jgi:predicted enzyme related to lactoylglutathione lyase
VQWLHVVIDVPPALADEAARFWSAALGWPAGDPWRSHPEFRSFEAADGDAYVLLQVGDHDPRVHIDLEVDDIDAEADRLAALGAAIRPRGAGWQPMSSPGGLPFCLVARSEHENRPSAPRWGDGPRTRLVQVCIDSPAGLHDQEVAFWRAALDWRWEASADEEFAGKLYPPEGSPVQVLLQRLGADDGGMSTRVHIDLGSDDIAADADRLEMLGAARIGPGQGWIALRDPAGVAFCTTRNRPE